MKETYFLSSLITHPFFDASRKEISYDIERSVSFLGRIYNMHALNAYSRTLNTVGAELFACDRIEFRHGIHANFVHVNNFHITANDICIRTDYSFIRHHSGVATEILNGYR